MNSEYVKQALAKVENPNILVNVISRRVRQLTSGGSSGRPLIEHPPGMGIADIALLELIEGKMDFEITNPPDEDTTPAPKKRRRV